MAEVVEVSDELVEAFVRLIPQLSSSSAPTSRDELDRHRGLGGQHPVRRPGRRRGHRRLAHLGRVPDPDRGPGLDRGRGGRRLGPGGRGGRGPGGRGHRAGDVGRGQDGGPHLEAESRGGQPALRADGIRVEDDQRVPPDDWRAPTERSVQARPGSAIPPCRQGTRVARQADAECRVGSAGGTSAPPSSEMRGSEPNSMSDGVRTCRRSGPRRARSVIASSNMLGDTNENDSARCARSAVEFIRMRTRLSHWDSTLSCTLSGRCVDTRRCGPNFRPSAAIWMRVACGQGDQSAFGVLGAHVVSLVDHDQDRPAVTVQVPESATRASIQATRRSPSVPASDPRSTTRPASRRQRHRG